MPEAISNPTENKDFPVTFVRLFGHIPFDFPADIVSVE